MMSGINNTKDIVVVGYKMNSPLGNKIQNKLDEIEFADLRHTIKTNIENKLDENKMALQQIIAEKTPAQENSLVLDINDKQNIIRMYRMGKTLSQITYACLIGNYEVSLFKQVDMALHKKLANKINDVILGYKELPINRQRASHPEELV